VKANRQICSALTALQQAEQAVMRIGDQLGLQEEWKKESPEYKAVKEGMVMQGYQLALDELEQLVVQRLFELAKLNMTGTGELVLLLQPV
jgi:hypothetical protein